VREKLVKMGLGFWGRTESHNLCSSHVSFMFYLFILQFARTLGAHGLFSCFFALCQDISRTVVSKKETR